MSRIDFVGLALQPGGMGAEETTMEYYVPVETASPTTDRQTLTMEETIGSRFPTGLEYGTKFFTIPMVGAPRPASLPRLISGFAGQPVTSTGGPPGTHKHLIDSTVDVPLAHSIYAVRMDPAPPIVDLFWDAKGNELALDVAPNDFLRMSATYIALQVDGDNAAPTPTSDLTKRWKFSECCVEISVDDETTWLPKQSAAWGVTYNNNLDTDNAILCSQELFGLPDGNVDLEVRWSPREDMEEAYRRYLADDPVTIAVRMTALSATAKFVVTVHACETTDATAPISGADVLKQIDVTLRGKVAETGSHAGKFVDFEVTNDVAAYATLAG